MKKRNNRQKLQENQETLKYNVNIYCIMPDREMDKTIFRIDAHMSEEYTLKISAVYLH